MILEKQANVYAGQIMTRVSADAAKGEEVIAQATVLVPKAISNGVVIREYLGKAELKQHLDAEKVTKKGDIVIKLSTPYDCTYITEENEGLAVPSFCAIIRGLDDSDVVDAKYFTAFLNTEYMREQLKAKVVGSTMAMIKITDIRKIKCPDISIEKQRELGKAYFLSCQKKETLKKMIEAEDELMTNIILNSIKEAI